MQQDRKSVLRSYRRPSRPPLSIVFALLALATTAIACRPRPLVAFAERYETPSTVRLIVLVEDGAVTVTEGPPGAVVVSGEHPEDVHEYSGSVAAGEARIELRRQRKLEFRIGQRGAHLDVQVPSGSSVEIDASNGPVEVDGAFEVSRVKASNGAIHVADARGALTIDSSNGRTQVDRHAGRLTVRGSNGAIDVTGHEGGAVTLHTSNGAVRYEGTIEPSGDSQLETSNGAIEVVVQGPASFILDAATSNGGVTSRFALLDGTKGDARLTGRVGDGAARLVLRASNGAIEVR